LLRREISAKFSGQEKMEGPTIEYTSQLYFRSPIDEKDENEIVRKQFPF
jgi:hypothetical protein